jgi:hypothetical protein
MWVNRLRDPPQHDQTLTHDERNKELDYEYDRVELL